MACTSRSRDIERNGTWRIREGIARAGCSSRRCIVRRKVERRESPQALSGFTAPAPLGRHGASREQGFQYRRGCSIDGFGPGRVDCVTRIAPQVDASHGNPGAIAPPGSSWSEAVARPHVSTPVRTWDATATPCERGGIARARSPASQRCALRRIACARAAVGGSCLPLLESIRIPATAHVRRVT